jgi:hypothetical protein
VPAAQQALLFAGKSLEDGDYIVEDLRLDRYNTRQEVMIWTHDWLRPKRDYCPDD